MSVLQTNGLTLAFTTNPIAYDLVDYNQDGETADDVDLSNLASTDTRPYQPGELKEGGTYTFLVQFDPTKVRLKTGVLDEANITFPLSDSANSNQATEVFDTYINSFSKVGQINELIVSTVVLKVAGPIVFTEET